MGEDPWPFHLRGLREFLDGPFFVPTKEGFPMLGSGCRPAWALDFSPRLRAVALARA